MAGSIYLIPVTLGDDNYSLVIPSGVLSVTRSLRYFIVEDIRTARRYLRLIDPTFPIDDSRFFILDKHDAGQDLKGFLAPARAGNDMGLMSEAGLPGIADPGSEIVSLAHLEKIKVTPLSGPSSIILALIGSGMNGQNFTFHGYLPVKADKRGIKLREIERRSLGGETQIFMETPYRASHVADHIISICHPDTRLCIATDITLASESIRTMRISEWRNNKPDLDKRLVVFLINCAE